ncbi:MAG TPA: tRNA (adenosine(37)-N6)-threonylcarbamoyltransferase complex ATPase subunit type 1 TsaE [Candidatus Dormibacteraeota bacterium]|nr:tRNA (adenosine(37)-N6)-threonylcarbamoyltransferase complex ATPase subunit type 1 TsaE [Candidatus Dormibacteraeota bacterium]
MTRVRRSSGSEAETVALGERLGRCLRAGDAVALDGPLGAGKTVLVRGLVAGAGASGTVRSPTFVLHAVHPGPVPVHHLDLYRLSHPVDPRALGLDEMLETGAVVVEWAERVAAGPPEWFDTRCQLSITGPAARALELTGPERLRAAWARD